MKAQVRLSREPCPQVWHERKNLNMTTERNWINIDPKLVQAECVDASCHVSRIVAEIQRGNGTVEGLTNAAKALNRLLSMVGMPIADCVFTKMRFNEIKFPIDAGKSLKDADIKKCQEYSKSCGIVKGTDAVVFELHMHKWIVTGYQYQEVYPGMIMAMLAKSKEFVANREWQKHETKENICLAIMSEVGEMCHSVSFLQPGDKVAFSVVAKMALEVADCFVYLCRLADICGLTTEWTEHMRTSSLQASP